MKDLILLEEKNIKAKMQWMKKDEFEGRGTIISSYQVGVKT